MNSAPDQFDQARDVMRRDGRRIVQTLFPGGEWKGKEYWVKNPMRSDRNPGSFSISENGFFNDFAGGPGGDLLDILVATRGISKTAAASLIIETGGRTPSTATAPGKTDKPKSTPAEYIPEEKINDLEKHTSKKFIRDRFGIARAVWPYRYEGKLWMMVVRHETRDGKKNLIPYHVTVDGTWSAGNPKKTNRPLFNIDKLKNNTAPVLIAEGEKCASVQVPGFIVVTWCGGSQAVNKTDWRPLKGRAVTIWPDADEAGIGAALAIREKLPAAEILKISDRPKGWDIADADAEGLDLAAFIASCPRITSKPKNIDIVIGSPIETPGMRYWKVVQDQVSTKIPTIDFSSYEMNDDHAGRLFVDIYKEFFRYNTTNENYVIWTGTYWTPDIWNLAERAAAETAKLFQTKLADMDPASLRDAAAFIKRIRSASGVRAILYMASSEPRIVTSQTDYDNNPDLLNTPGGTIELKSGVMREHRREDLITKITAYTPDSDHSAEMFLEFLNKITLGREDLKESLQRSLGSGCSGKSPKDKIGAHWGEGQNGKSVLLEACGDCLKDYMASLDIKSLCINERQNSGHTDDIAILHGKRYVLSSESNQAVRLDEAKIKKYSGGDTIPASFKHGRTFFMRPCFTLAILTNHKLKITGRDKGIWRRITLFPYDYIVPESEKDLDYKVKLLAACGPYIMHWLVEGAQKWYSGGYGSFETTDKATSNYKAEEDIIGTFIDECCDVESGFSVQANQLRAAYQRWADQNGEVLFSGRAWREALEEHGFQRRHGMNGNTWFGLRLIQQETGII